MEILDQSFEARIKPQPLNWLGKAFYIGEGIMILVLLLLMTDIIGFDEEIALIFFLGYYSLFAAIFVLFSNAFPIRIDKVFGLISVLAFSTIAAVLYFSDWLNNGVAQIGFISVIALMSLFSFIFFLVRAIGRNKQTSIWSYVGMLVRLGIFLLPIFVYLYFRLNA